MHQGINTEFHWEGGEGDMPLIPLPPYLLMHELAMASPLLDNYSHTLHEQQ